MFVDRIKEFEETYPDTYQVKDKKFLSGIFRVNIKDINFDMLVINNDDTSIVDRYWDNSYFDFTIEKWSDWSKSSGVFIDIGAHTGIFSLLTLKSSKNNYIIAVEPLPINYYRIITNFRLNYFDFSRSTILNFAISNENKTVQFRTGNDLSYLNKGGSISNQGIKINAFKLDDLKINLPNLQVRAIKIDTEGEDLNVLYGGKNLIYKHKPKIVIETRQKNIHQIIKFLSEMGYKKIYDKNNLISKNNPITFNTGEEVRDLFFEFN